MKWMKNLTDFQHACESLATFTILYARGATSRRYGILVDEVEIPDLMITRRTSAVKSVLWQCWTKGTLIQSYLPEILVVLDVAFDVDWKIKRMAQKPETQLIKKIQTIRSKPLIRDLHLNRLLSPVGNWDVFICYTFLNYTFEIINKEIKI